MSQINEVLSALQLQGNFSNIIFATLLTILAYFIAIKFYRQSGQSPWLQPVLIAALMIIAVLHIPSLDYDMYKDGTGILDFLLGTATVALAYPLYKNLPLIKANLPAIVLLIVTGGVIASSVAITFAWLFEGSTTTILSVAPKSITTPIAIGVSEAIGGLPSLTAAMVILTGIIVAVFAPWMFRMLHIDDPMVKGMVMGINGHGIGTAAAFEIDMKTGAFSALAMSLMGIYIATFLPVVLTFFVSY